MSNSYVWPIDRILSGATSLDQSEPGNDGNEGVLRIPQISSITGASYTRLFNVLSGTLVGEDAVSEFYNPSRLGAISKDFYEFFFFLSLGRIKWNKTI